MTICKGIKYLDEYLDEHLLPWTVKHRNTEQVQGYSDLSPVAACITSNITMNSLMVYLNLTIILLKAFICELRWNPTIWLGCFPNIL